jgi:outer membrane protein assembly factor BamA
LQYELENDDVRLPSRTQELLSTPNPLPTDIPWLRFPSGDFPLQSLRPTVTLDFRDDIARPTRGLLFSGSAEWTNDLGATLADPSGHCPTSNSPDSPAPATTSSQRDASNDPCAFPIHTLKLSGSLTGYVPVAARTVLALSVRGGKIVHLTQDSESIAPKRFFLGGSTSMRGFSEEGIIPQDRRYAMREEVAECQSLGESYPRACTPNALVLQDGRQLPSEGGELYTLLKSELRLPAFGPFDLGLFFEAGNLWLNPANYQPLVLRYVTGAGVRYGTPIGPLALDLGINLFPDTVLNEPRANLHFSIGLF